MTAPAPKLPMTPETEARERLEAEAARATQAVRWAAKHQSILPSHFERELAEIMETATVSVRLADLTALLSKPQGEGPPAWTVRDNPDETDELGQAFDVKLPNGEWWTVIAVGPEDARSEAEQHWREEQAKAARYAAPKPQGEAGAGEDALTEWREAARVQAARAEALAQSERRLREAGGDLLDALKAENPTLGLQAARALWKFNATLSEKQP